MNSTDSTKNGQPPRDPRAAAGCYLERGWFSIPIPLCSKAPTIDDWPNLRPSAADLDALFPTGRETNLGLLLGQPSGNLLDADLDILEAVRAAKVLMPRTRMVSGRKSKPHSHLWYRADNAPDKTEQFQDPTDKSMVLELRSTGGQTVVPWSVHESGEIVGWYDFGEPSQQPIEELRRAVHYTAAAALLGKYWPDQGGRHQAALALAGGLLVSADWTIDFTKRFLSAVCAAAQDNEEQDRLAAVDSTKERFAQGENITGWPTLAESLKGDGAKIVKRIKQWLGITRKKGKQDGGEKGEKEKESAATLLVKLATEAGVEVLHSPDQIAYALVPCGTHKETWPLKSTGFRRWLARLFYESEEKTAPAEAVSAALATLEGFALFDGEEVPVHVRLAGDLDKICLDLADEAWRVVEIDANGWRIVDESPVRFIRPRGLLTLPEPQHGGKLSDLRAFANVRDENAWKLLLGFLFGVFHPAGPYPILLQVGEQGSAKSTLGRLIRSLIDPNKAPLRRKPRDERDLAIAANNGWLIAFDNLSDFPDWLSDAICCISTGGGFSTRELYTDSEEAIFSYKRPVLLTAIEDILSRGDALDRTISLELEPIPRNKRRTEKAIEKQFEPLRPRLLGALLDAVAGGLRLLPSVQLDRLPRMADFCLWAEACGQSIGWKPGEFLDAYEMNRDEINSQALDYSPVVPVLRQHLPEEPENISRGTREGEWKGTASELLEWLNHHFGDDKKQKPKGWPAGAKGVGNLFRRLAPNLRREGFRVEFDRESGGARRRTIELKAPDTDHRPESKDIEPSPPSPPSRDDDSIDTNPENTGDCNKDFGEQEEGELPSRDRPATVPERPDRGNAQDSGTVRDSAGTVAGQSIDIPDSECNYLSDKELSDFGTVRDVRDGSLHSLSGSLSDCTAYRVVRDAADLSMAAQAVQDSSRVALDCETSGLDPRHDRIRLLQLATEHGLYLIDCFAVDPRPLFDSLVDAVLIGHNLSFDLSFLAALGFEPRDVRCTMLLSQLLHGTRRPKGFHSLQETSSREIGRTIDKEQQRSDWTGDLSREQLDYAAADVAVLMPLYDALAAKIEAAGMARVADIENRCLPAMVWLEHAGAPFDRTAWEALAEQAKQEAKELGRQLDQLAPEREGYLSKTGAWNWDSPQQVQQVLQLLGFNLESTDDDTLATVPHPIADLVRRRRSAKKRTGTYGKKWLKHVADDGRVYASFHQIGADTGRMSCSAPNLQQIPNDPAYRRCFRAPEGRVLVKADYSQIELRIACRIAAERRMRKAYDTGADLHRITAQKMTGREEVTKEERAMAKPVNFGMIYGLSPEGLKRKAKSEYGIDLSEQDAMRFRDAFFAAWPDIKKWHNGLRTADPSEVPTLAGRLLRLPEKRHFGMIANYSVQGTGGDGVKAALGLLWERRGECPGARPVLVVHDEIVLECPREQAEAAAEWLKRAMVEGMAPLIKPVPVEVETKISQSWAGD